MTKNQGRRFYNGIMRMLPLRLRSIENYYFLWFSVLGIIIPLFMSPLLAYADFWRPAWSTALSSMIIAGLLVLWRVGVSIYKLQFFFQATLMWLILFNSLETGGVNSPVMVWMGVIPLLPLFTVSRLWSYISLFVSFLLVVTVYIAQTQGLVPILVGLGLKELTISALMICLLCAFQIILIISYDSINLQHIRNIERKNSTLEKLSQDLKNANVHKDKFLATVSHEMRTPLNALMGFLGLLRNMDQLPTLASSYVQGAQNSSAHLLTVINDLLDYSQIQQGKLILSPQTFNLSKVIKETHASLALKAATQALNFPLQMDDNLPQWVRTDPHRFTQIFLNLLDNALKFTLSGSVTTKVSFEPDPQDAQSGTLILIVHDTGIGIAKRDLQRIFYPFTQIQGQPNTFNDNALRGNGLGLSITKNLLINLEGSIKVDSLEGVGSTFEVHCPIKIMKHPPTSKTTSASEIYSDKIYLLIVDDHATNRLVTSATIKRDIPNAIIDEARNGSEAIEMMRANSYDVVLMDLIMPDKSGIDVTRIIRSECPPPFCDVKVIALTANIAEAAIKECMEVGISEVLRKPFERETLIQTILQATS